MEKERNDYSVAFETLGDTANDVILTVNDLISAMVVAFFDLSEKRISMRCKHLALYGQGRTKKKNLNRIKKVLRRRYGKQQ